MKRVLQLSLLALFLFSCRKENSPKQDLIEITDALGRRVSIPKKVERVICSGAGSLRYLTYLQAQNMVVAVDNGEKKNSFLKSRPYSLANPQFREFPIFGEYRGKDNIELIAGLNPQPQVIFKTYSDMGVSPDELQKKSGIPVVALHYGNLTNQKEDLQKALRMMGKAVHKEQRAEEVISFFDTHITTLKERTKEQESKSCFVGGIAFKGPHGILSTEPNFAPFHFTNAKNVAFDSTKRHAIVSKEKLLQWNPEILFVDLSSTQLKGEGNPLHDLEKNPIYRNLQAQKKRKMYGLLPYNSYTTNIGSVLANSYYVGKVLHPKQFEDIDPQKKANEIYSFLVGKKVFSEMNRSFSNNAFINIVW